MNTTLKSLAIMLATAGLCLTGIATAQQEGMQPQQKTDQERNIIIYERSVIGVDSESRLTTTVNLPAGLKPKEDARVSAAEEAIRNVISTATDAVMKGDLNKLIEQLSGPDRERLEEATEMDLNPLRRGVDTLTKAFNEAYGLAFALTDDDLSATNMAVRVAEVGDPAQMNNWPLAPVSGRTISTQGTVNPDYMNEGRDVAVVVLPRAGGIPELTVSMTHEAPDFWKIDVPDTLSLADLQRNVSDALSNFAQEANTWPPDQNETERLLARRILMALYSVEPRQSGMTQ